MLVPPRKCRMLTSFSNPARLTSMKRDAGPWNQVAVIQPSSCHTVRKRSQSPASRQTAQLLTVSAMARRSSDSVLIRSALYNGFFAPERGMASVLKPGSAAGRQEFYRRMDKDNLAPLWEVLHALVPPQPQGPCKPGYWNYRAIRPYIEESGRAITAKEAVRRVLILENPGMRGQSCITRSLYCGLQLILPGEVAPSHRHTQSALRFIVEGSGAYTAVDGERTVMHPGDFIITPSWTWHDHGNPGTEPVVWMDGLDIQILALFDAQ